MSFEYPPATARLSFDDGPLTGLKVVVRSPSTDAQFALENMPASYDGRLSPFRPAMEALAALLVSWNLTEGGQPVPCDRAQFFLRGAGFTSTVFGRWAVETRELLAQAASSAQIRPSVDEGEIPMTVLSSVPEFDPSAIPMETIIPAAVGPESTSGKAQRAPRRRSTPKRVTAQPDTAEAI